MNPANSATRPSGVWIRVKGCESLGWAELAEQGEITNHNMRTLHSQSNLGLLHVYNQESVYIAFAPTVSSATRKP